MQKTDGQQLTHSWVEMQFPRSSYGMYDVYQPVCDAAYQSLVHVRSQPKPYCASKLKGSDKTQYLQPLTLSNTYVMMAFDSRCERKLTWDCVFKSYTHSNPIIVPCKPMPLGNLQDLLADMNLTIKADGSIARFMLQ